MKNFLILFSFISWIHADAKSMRLLNSIEYSVHNQLTLENQLELLKSQTPLEKFRPFASFEKTSIVAMSSDFGDYPEVQEMKTTIAKHLPKNVRLLLSVKDLKQKEEMLAFYGQWIDPSRLSFTVTGRDGDVAFWARDSFPFPVVSSEDNTSQWFVVDAKSVLISSYEPDQQVAQSLEVPLFSHQFAYPGGNLISDDKGNCFRVKSRRGSGMPSDAFKNYYGCKTLSEFQQYGGIGDIDERMAFVSPTLVITDTPEYVPLIKEKGYDVVMLPRPMAGSTTYQTYANFLFVNGTIFLPIFDAPEDEEAIRTLKDLGFIVHAVSQKQVSNTGQGNVHCYTVNYPELWREKR